MRAMYHFKERFKGLFIQSLITYGKCDYSELINIELRKHSRNNKEFLNIILDVFKEFNSSD
jgi:hypothetical protein